MTEDNSKKILIVEDEVIVAFDLEQRLSRAGYAVVGSVRTGVDAITKAGQAQPDVILMDIRLKDEMDGLQAAEVISTQMDTAIIVMTAQSDPVTTKEILSKGYAGYVEKPFKFEVLLSTIAEIVDS